MKKLVAGGSIIGLAIVLSGCEFSFSENAVNEISSTYKIGCPFVSGHTYTVGTISTDSPAYKYTDNTYNFEVIDDDSGYTNCRLRWVDNGKDSKDDSYGQALQATTYYKISPNRYVALLNADYFSFSKQTDERLQRAYIVEVSSDKINFIGCKPPEDNNKNATYESECVIRSVSDLQNVSTKPSLLMTEFFLK